MQLVKIIVPFLGTVLVCILMQPHQAAAQNRAVPYTATLEGAPSDEAQQAILLQADTFAREDRPPRTRALLRKRVADDLPTIRSILQSLGYYKIQISTDVDTNISPARVSLNITPGPLFRMGTVTLEGVPDNVPLSPQIIGLAPGTPATAAAIRKGEDILLDMLGNHGHPFARSTSRDVVVDHALNQVNILWKIDPGPACTFGPVTITGLDQVNPEFVHRTIAWQEGETFNATAQDTTRMKLLKSGLFGTVRIEHADTPQASGSLPMSIVVQERVPRTVKAGLEYATDTGPGATFSWEHRNLFHDGELLRTRGQINDITQGADVRLMFPAFFGPWQMTTEGALAREYTDAYTSKSITTGMMLERRQTPWLRTGGGVRYRLNTVDDSEGDKKTYGLISVPVFADAVKAAPMLDPTSGWTLKGETAPYLDLLGENIFFVKSRVQGSVYLPLLPSRKLTLALRGALGVLGGTGLQDIPANERFYAGGGGSVRGYAYQKAGDLDDDNDPTGGLSKLECAAELRATFTKTLGGVVFLDGGRAFPDAVPDDLTDLFWGAGAGLRYFTPIGPLRLDAAFPLNKRNSIDDAFQIYISIGQAF
ncbi:autotransporter assembly complex protein TamA [Desulfoplanes formicivorans]|nr:BamA/TamA family outer membrane protein [Desulfoplanes formicivorans]